jgi:hypothetical protein
MAGGGYGAWIVTGILAHFPNVKPWTMVIKPICIAITILGIFMYGAAGVTAIYQAQILQMENDIKVAQQASTDVDTAVTVKIKSQTKVIHDTRIVYQERIQEIAKKIDADCKLDPDAVSTINSAAKNPLGDNR